MNRRWLRLLSCLVAAIALGDVAALAMVDDDSSTHDGADPTAQGVAPHEAPSERQPADGVRPATSPTIGPTSTSAVASGQQFASKATAPPVPAPKGGARPPTPDLALQLTVTPSCALRGGKLKATLRTAPRTWVAFAVAYADGRNHDQQGTGQANRDGVFEHTWLVPPDAAPGQGYFLVSAYDGEGHRSGVAQTTFTVAELTC